MTVVRFLPVLAIAMLCLLAVRFIASASNRCIAPTSARCMCRWSSRIPFVAILGERLTEAIVREIELKTPYKVVGADRADSVLRARLVTESKRVINETGFDDPRDLEIDYFVQLSWTDRRGDLIMNHCDVPASRAAHQCQPGANFVPEAGQSLSTAQQELITKLAEQIVGRWKRRGKFSSREPRGLVTLNENRRQNCGRQRRLWCPADKDRQQHLIEFPARLLIGAGRDRRGDEQRINPSSTITRCPPRNARGM